MTRLSPETRILRSPDAAWRMLDETLVAVTPHDTAIHRFNGSASFLWSRIGEQGITVSELLQAFLSQYDVSPAEAAGDMRTFLAKALKRRLVYAAP